MHLFPEVAQDAEHVIDHRAGDIDLASARTTPVDILLEPLALGARPDQMPVRFRVAADGFRPGSSIGADMVH